VSVSPTLAASAACFRGGKVLIAKRIKPPLWSLPGGRIEPGETPEAAEVAWVEPDGLSAYKTTDGLLPIVLEAKRLIG
jgi:hypothetical protein